MSVQICSNESGIHELKMSENVSHGHHMRPNRSPFTFMHSHAVSCQTVSGSAQGATGTVTENTTEDERVSGTTDNVGQGTVKKRAQIIL